MSIQIELQATIADLVVKGKGILAADESHPTMIGVENGFHRPLPPNPVCSFPATGSPVSCFHIGIGTPIYGLLTS